MAENAGDSGDAQVTFKVKSGADVNHTITMAESASVLDLKTKLATDDYENIPVERQRLIYSGRVMKNDDSLGSYKIKSGNTIHLVKSAASNQQQAPSSSSTPAPPAVPQNMAAGTEANNLLAGLTGARFAGMANLPGRDMFGADGGMGAPPNEDQMADLLSDPNVAQSMNQALSNPQFIDFMIQSNPMLRSMPNARELLTSPYFRNMLTNPDALRSAARIRRAMGGGPGGAGAGGMAFPAPGATDTTPAGAPASGESNAGGQAQGQQPPNPLAGLFGAPAGGADAGANPFAALFGGGGGGGGAGTNPFGLPQPFAGAGANMGAPPTPGAQTGAADASRNEGTTGAAAPAATGSAGLAGSNPAANPFAALFNMPGQGQGDAAANPFGGAGLPNLTPEMMQQAMSMWGMGGAGSPPAPADNRPPEERYAEQLRQLNEMGFYDFDRNVAALRRSGGSVQGAIEHLLNG